MKTIYNNKVMRIGLIYVEMPDRERCVIELDPGEGSPVVNVTGHCWSNNEHENNPCMTYGEYEMGPLCFIPFDVHDQAKLEIIRLFEKAYGNTENDVETWALEFELFVRNLLDGYLMVNPHYLEFDESDDFFDKILEISKKMEKISVSTPFGEIEAEISPDKNYPGIFLNYIGENGCPGAVMDYSPEADTVEMRVYCAEAPDGEPVDVLTMASRDLIYSDLEKRLEVTNTSSIASNRKDAFAIFDKKYDRLYAGADGTVLTYQTEEDAKKGLEKVLTMETILSQVDATKITGTAYISVTVDRSGVYVDLNYTDDPEKDDAGTDYDILFVARPDDESGYCESEAKFEASYIAKVASEMFGLDVRTE